jgi:predicted enzyme related to lactoylglutathione lyase
MPVTFLASPACLLTIVGYTKDMINLNNIMIGTEDSTKLSDFYKKVFDKEADMHDGDWYGWQFKGAFFSIGNHSEVKGKSKEPARIIFNFETREIKEEFERIKATGAKVIKEPYDAGEGMMIATFEDPDGNYFQLMPPWEN